MYSRERVIVATALRNDKDVLAYLCKLQRSSLCLFCCHEAHIFTATFSIRIPLPLPRFTELQSQSRLHL